MSTARFNKWLRSDGSALGPIIQVRNLMDGAVATGTTTIPYDDTVPQNTEGTQFMELAVTPKSVSNMLKITVVFWGAVSATTTDLIVALFQDSGADAIAVTCALSASTNMRGPLVLVHYMEAGTISETTFKVRAGGSGASTITFNGSGGTRKFGGVAASSITIEEIQV